MTPKKMVTIVFAEGLERTFIDAYFMCVDMGEFHESETLRAWCHKQDKLMADEGLSAREYIAKYGRENL